MTLHHHQLSVPGYYPKCHVSPPPAVNPRGATTEEPSGIGNRPYARIQENIRMQYNNTILYLDFKPIPTNLSAICICVTLLIADVCLTVTVCTETISPAYRAEGVSAAPGQAAVWPQRFPAETRLSAARCLQRSGWSDLLVWKSFCFCFLILL